MQHNTVSTWEAGRWEVPITSGQLNVSQHLMCRLRSEFDRLLVKRPPTCVVGQLGSVSAAGHGLATCGRCVPLHTSFDPSLSLDLYLNNLLQN